MPWRSSRIRVWRVSSQATTSAVGQRREHPQRDVLEVADRGRADHQPPNRRLGASHLANIGSPRCPANSVPRCPPTATSPRSTPATAPDAGCSATETRSLAPPGRASRGPEGARRSGDLRAAEQGAGRAVAADAGLRARAAGWRRWATPKRALLALLLPDPRLAGALAAAVPDQLALQPHLARRATWRAVLDSGRLPARPRPTTSSCSAPTAARRTARNPAPKRQASDARTRSC